MGSSISSPLDTAEKNASKRVGDSSVSGRIHRLPRRLEDDYTPTREILGEGFNGHVFLAKNNNTGLEYAVKPFKLRGLDQETKQDLTNEVEIFLSMDHPHIARLSDCYQSEDKFCLVMECCTGGELLRRISKKRRFSEKDAVETTFQMLLAVRYIHSHNIVHRDIKLENFLFEKPDTDFIKLIDFGFSKVFKPNAHLHQSCGTMPYLAPEVFSGKYTHQCDMWSLGVTVFILLYGKFPFNGKNKAALERQITKRKLSVDTKACNDVSAAARDFVESLLKNDPTERLTSQRALDHPWIAERSKMSLDQGGIREDIVDSLQTFGQSSEFRKACMSMMAWSLTQAEREQIRKAFLEIDTDHSGAVTLGEFKRVLQDQFHMDDERVIQAFKSIDASHTEEIHYSEFLAATLAKRLDMHDDLLKKTFSRFDIDGNGCISKQELSQTMGSRYSGKDVQKLIAEADTSHDDQIDFDEFVRFIKRDGSTEHHEDVGRIIDDEHRHHGGKKMRIKNGSSGWESLTSSLCKCTSRKD
jgi:calcium-dependent protein kinase